MLIQKLPLKLLRKRVLPNLMHENQSGYIPGRNIYENIRSILDIMEYTKDSNKPGILSLKKLLIA